MKKFLIIIGLLLVLLGGGALIAPTFIDWNKYKQPILHQINQTTGYEVSVSGALDLAILPYPRVMFEGLAVKVPGEDSALLTLDKAAVAIALPPLFNGEIEVSSIQLTNPRFQAVIDADGNPGWMTPVLEQRMAASKAGAPSEAQAPGMLEKIALNEIKIRNGALVYRNEQQGTALQFDDINVTLRGDSVFGPYDLKGHFSYEDHVTEINVTSGRIDNLADSIALEVDATWPDLDTVLSYSGVVAVEEMVEFQGEAEFESEKPGKFLAVFNQKIPAHLDKSIKLKGITSFSPEEVAYRNLRITYGTFTGNGQFTAKKLGQGQTPELSLQIESAGMVDLASYLPPDDKKVQSGIPRLPETIVLPAEFYILFDGKFGSLKFNDVTYENVALSIRKDEKGVEGQLKLFAPGTTVLDVDGQLAFGARSVSPQDKSVTLSAPSLSLSGQFSSEEPAKLYGAAVKQKAPEVTARVFSAGLTLETQATVTPEKIEMPSLSLNVQETPLKIGMSYLYGNRDKRDLLKLGVTSYALDLDKWMQVINGSTNDNSPVVEKKHMNFDSLFRQVALPFDLDLTLSAQTIKFKNETYDKLEVKGGLYDRLLQIETLALQNIQGEGLNASGTVKNIQTLEGIDLSIGAKTENLKSTLQSFAIESAQIPDSAGAADVAAELKGSADLLAFTANVSALRATIEASGQVNHILGKRQIDDLTMRLRHPNYVSLARLYNPSFSSGVGIKKALDIYASVERDKDVYDFRELKAVIGPSEITGAVSADMGGDVPVIKADLQLGDLPLGEFLGMENSPGNRIKSSSLRKPEDVRWSRNALPTDWMHAADMDLKASARSISAGRWVFENAGANLSLKNGLLTINQLDGGLAGGHVAFTGTVKGASEPRDPLVINAGVLMQNISLEEFVRSFSGSSLLRAKGTINLQSDIKATGISPAALIFDLSGTGAADGADLVFEGFDLARLSRALAEPTSSFTENFTRLLDTTMSGGTTMFDTLDSTFTIAEGVVTFDKLFLDGPAASVNGTGNVNLPLWSIDLTTVVSLKEPKNAPKLQTTFKGPLDRPGHTFGQSAMQQYFQKQIEGLILNPVLDKIQKETGLPFKPQSEATGPAPETTEQPASGDQPSQQQQRRRQPSAEEAIFGVIEGILKEQ